MEFWGRHEFVTPQNGYHGPHFQTTRGTTQGGFILTTLFNMVVKNVVRKWLSITVEDKTVTQNGLGLAVGWCMGMFYTDYGLVG